MLRAQVLFFGVLFIASGVNAYDDCYTYNRVAFKTIEYCKHGCEYVYMGSDDKPIRYSGGCATNEEVGCRKSSDGLATVCTCQGNLCNIRGYEMPGEA